MTRNEAAHVPKGARVVVNARLQPSCGRHGTVVGHTRDGRCLRVILDLIHAPRGKNRVASVIHHDFLDLLGIEVSA